MVGRRGWQRLSPYLPRLAIQWAESGDERAWQEVDGTLVFVDISGFTALSERLAQRGREGGEELTTTLNACFAELLAVAYARHGSLVKFGGDALLLLFDRDDHPQRACEAALAMRTTMARVGNVRTSVGAVRLRMSVGVHSGRILALRVGASHRELILTGPAASATVDMESTATAGEILVSAATASSVDPALLGPAKGDGILLRRRAVQVEPAEIAALRAPAVDISDGVPLALRELLLGGAVDSEHRTATVGFVHYDGVDDLYRRHGAGAVSDAVDQFVRITQAAVDEEGVTFLGSDIDRDGGKLILVAGAPRAQEDDDGRMLRALRRVMDARPPLPVRAGANRGHVFAGEVGPWYRRTFTVMGDAVNLSARLMAKAEPGQILAPAGVLDQARTEFEVEALEPFSVKGKSAPVHAFAVGAPVGRRAAQETSGTPFVGRGRELRSLLDGIAAARNGKGSSFDVVGDPGVGKSRLVAELLAGADVDVLTTAGEPYMARTPYAALRPILAAALGHEHLDGVTLREHVARVAPSLSSRLPLLATVAGVEAEVDPTDEVDALDPRFRPEQTRAALVALLEATVPGPAVFLVDDAQWLDDATIDALRTLRQTAARRCWVVLATHHPGSPALDPATAVQIELDPLDASTARRLVAAASSAPLPPHERDALIERSGGNPLFLTELVRARAGTNDDGALPESLEAVVAKEIDRLPPSDRRLLRNAAVLGVDVDPQVLVEIVDPDLREVAGSARRRLRAFLQPSGHGQLRFRNQVFRDVAYSTLPFGRRRHLHGRAADVIERRAGPNAAERADILSVHLMEARRYRECWRYARAAAEQAKAQYALVESAALFDRAAHAGTAAAVDTTEVVDAWREAGNAHRLVGAYDAAKAAYDSALRLVKTDPATQAELFARQAMVAERRSGGGAAVRWIKRGLRLVEGTDDTESAAKRAELEVLLAWRLMATGRHREAIAMCERAVGDARRGAARRSEAQAYAVLDACLTAVGRAGEATHALDALRIWEDLGDVVNQASILNNLGAMAYYGGRWSEAIERYEQAAVRLIRAGAVIDAAMAGCNVAEILIDQGLLDEATKRLDDAEDVWGPAAYNQGLAMVRRHRGRLAMRAGRLDEALDLLEHARSTFAGTGQQAKVVEVDVLRAEALLRAGRLTEARSLVVSLTRHEGSSGATEHLPALHRLRGHLAALDGDLETAWAALDESLTVGRSRGATFEVATTLEALAALAAHRGGSEATSLLAERLRLLDDLGVRAAPAPLLTPDAAAEAPRS